MQNTPHKPEKILSLEIGKLISDLGSSNRRVRTSAEKRIRLLTDGEIVRLTEAFEYEWNQYLDSSFRLRTITEYLGGFMGLLCLLLAVLSLPKFRDNTISNLFPIIFVCFSVSLTSFFLLRNKPYPQNFLYHHLMLNDRMEMVRMLMEIHSRRPDWTGSEAITFLTRKLPQLPLSEWEKTTTKQRKALYSLLLEQSQMRTKTSLSFAISALKCLEQYGDSEAIPTVQSIVRHCKSEKIKLAAKACLPYLEIRRDEEEVRQTHLRASESSGGKDELLRLPTHQPDAESQQLLRMPPEEE